MKKIKLTLLIITLSLGCGDTAQEKKDKENKTLTNLVVLSALTRTTATAPGCDATIATVADSISYDGTSSSYRVCGSISTSTIVTFKKAGNYKITTTNGSVIYTSSRCNSITESISLSAFFKAETTSTTSGTVKTIAANDTITLQASRPSADKYTCSTGVTQTTQSSYVALIEAQ